MKLPAWHRYRAQVHYVPQKKISTRRGSRGHGIRRTKITTVWCFFVMGAAGPISVARAVATRNISRKMLMLIVVFLLHISYLLFFFVHFNEKEK